jgi:PAS domain S-box-containing protein
MWVFDIRSFAFLAVNDAAVRRYGFSREEFLSMTILDIRPGEDVVPLLRAELRDRKHSSDNERWRHRTCKGRVFEVEITSRPTTFNGVQAEIVLVREVE